MKRTRFTPTAREKFLASLASTGNVSASAEAISMSRRQLYTHRNQDAFFAELWDEAEAIAADALEAEARRRAVEGVEKPLVSAGRLVKDDDGQPIRVREYSDSLLALLLKARNAPVFGDRQKIEHLGAGGGPVQMQVENLTPERAAEIYRERLAHGKPGR
jgi:hypothetical protein